MVSVVVGGGGSVKCGERCRKAVRRVLGGFGVTDPVDVKGETAVDPEAAELF